MILGDMIGALYTYQDDYDMQFTFVDPIINQAPYLDPKPALSIELKEGQAESIQLGYPKDSDETTPLKIEVDFGTAHGFSTFVESERLIKFAALSEIETKKHKGNHNIVVTVREDTSQESFPLKTFYNILVTVKYVQLEETSQE